MKTPRKPKDHGMSYGKPETKEPEKEQDGATRPASNDGNPWPDPPPPPQEA
jgi:hypothetical protein